MSLPKPHLGLVINYAYLWHREHRRGQEEGRKDRPCAVVLALEKSDDKTLVSVVPITHSLPHDSDTAIELPIQVKSRLGLDGERSWVIVDEINYFEWPGPDIRPVPRTNPKRYEYGPLPPDLYKKISSKVVSTARAMKLKKVRRSE